MAIDETERLRRWRLVLGKDAQECMCSGTGKGEGNDGNLELSKHDLGMDRVLEALYDSERSAGASQPQANAPGTRDAGASRS